MMDRRLQRRRGLLLWAYLTHHMRKVPADMRELAVWNYLFAWAEAGGEPQDADSFGSPQGVA